MQYKQYIFLVLLWLGFVHVSAQDIIFKLGAPGQAEQESKIFLKYTLYNAKGDNFRFPDKVAGFDILMGPSVSFSQTMVNGELTTSTTYTYVVQATKPGTHTLPVASVRVDGKLYESDSQQIEILPLSKTENSDIGDNLSADKNKKAVDSGKGAFIRVLTSKTKIEDEKPLEVTYRLYLTAKENISDVNDIKLPDFDGFYKEEIKLPEKRVFKLERYNEVNYYTIDISKLHLYPERHGKIAVEPITVDATFNVKTGKTQDGLFGPEDILTQEHKKIKSGALTIEVLPDVPLIKKGETLDASKGDDAKTKSVVKKKKKLIRKSR
jgi:hypothetical protein